ncbi:MAG: CDP-alcohol phosphatidyltransferase family protein, partial [Bacteroidia bacterium]
MTKKSFYAINAITFYRLLVTPVLVILIFQGRQQVFGIMLGISLFTDLIDGYLARRFKVTSILGSRFDSIADDWTILCAIGAAIVFKFPFIKEQLILFGILFTLYLFQTLSAFTRYHKISS